MKYSLVVGVSDEAGPFEADAPVAPPEDRRIISIDDSGRVLAKNQVIDPDTLEWANQVQGTAVGGEEEVAVTNWPSTQAVSGPLTDAQLRASDVKVSLDGESVGVTGPVTDAQLRASDVKVTLDGEQVSVSNFPATQAVSAVSLPLPSGASTAAYQATLETLVETLQELAQRLAPLGSVVQEVGGRSLRVTGVTMPSTAVTGPLTNAQYVATPALGAIHYTQRTATENMNAVLSNVNNATGA